MRIFIFCSFFCLENLISFNVRYVLRSLTIFLKVYSKAPFVKTLSCKKYIQLQGIACMPMYFCKDFLQNKFRDLIIIFQEYSGKSYSEKTCFLVIYDGSLFEGQSQFILHFQFSDNCWKIKM